jgi:hypothetical protein
VKPMLARFLMNLQIVDSEIAITPHNSFAVIRFLSSVLKQPNTMQFFCIDLWDQTTTEKR